MYNAGTNKWLKRLCIIKDNQLLVYDLFGDEEPSESITSLKDCKLSYSSIESDREYVFKIEKDGHEDLQLEVGSILFVKTALIQVSL